MLPTEWKRKQAEKLKNQKIQPHRKISNTFIESAIQKSSLSALKTIYYLASIIEKMEEFAPGQQKSMLKLKIETPQMLKFTELKVPDIRRNLKKMQETSITFINEKDEIEEGISLIPYYKFIYGKGKIEIEIYQKIANLIVDVKRNYSMIDTKELMNLKNKHSLKMLPLIFRISQYDKDVPKRKKMELDDLNEFFGTKYKNLTDIERNILTPVKAELDTNSKLSFKFDINYVQIGVGRPKASNIIIDVITRKSYQPNLV